MILKHPLFLSALWLAPVFGATDSLVWNEFKPRLMTDFGHVVSGRYFYNTDLEFHPLNRNTIVLEQSASYGEQWEFNVGFKGIIWWPFNIGASEPHQRTLRVDPRLSQVRTRLNFERESKAYLEFGFFPYKYNPDAQNLGEYLHRSGAYPGIVRTTDGFQLMDYAVYEAYGAHFSFSHSGGIVSHEFTIFAEPSAMPVGDLTPGYEISLNLPIVQLGAGGVYNRLITFNSDRVRPKDYNNGYFEVDSIGGGGIEYTGLPGTLPLTSPVRSRIVAGDSATVRVLHYYTQQGIKLMARAAVDLGFLMPDPLRSPGDLRFFVEAALLGVENQVYFYEDRIKRMPIMAGVNLPTFGFLDRLCLQTEYYANPFVSSQLFNEKAYPIWSISPGEKEYDRDDWKWSLYARKSLNRILTVYVQAANDHLRLPLFHYNPSETDLTQTPAHWYYLVRLECRL